MSPTNPLSPVFSYPETGNAALLEVLVELRAMALYFPLDCSLPGGMWCVCSVSIGYIAGFLFEVLATKISRRHWFFGLFAIKSPGRIGISFLTEERSR